MAQQMGCSSALHLLGLNAPGMQWAEGGPLPPAVLLSAPLPQVSVRVMDIDVFMNSKRLFKDVRYRAVKPPKPVTVHINYHPGEVLGCGAEPGSRKRMPRWLCAAAPPTGVGERDSSPQLMLVPPPSPLADKHNRMKAVFKYYNGGDLHALDPFPGGSEKGTRRVT